MAKVRLIDANSARDMFEKLSVNSTMSEMQRSFCRTITRYMDDRTLFPTYKKVRPLRVGYWLKTGAKNVFGAEEVQCSKCNFKICFSPEHIQNIKEYERFCCRCGAEMKGVKTK